MLRGFRWFILPQLNIRYFCLDWESCFGPESGENKKTVFPRSLGDRT
ncbi:hypothetical protein PORCRE_718 [Porphyromonas crevioricanis JCM 15906]|uniref:Uncharacterized protein n=1 Tax=Porphyromonas crevioricanis JCM 15906 TaxID=1305617 RepID=T1CGX2_9PORP|nr:hypothetical protein PORCRE_718 [Porphyromonas crevioricanis JCM 15906]